MGNQEQFPGAVNTEEGVRIPSASNLEKEATNTAEYREAFLKDQGIELKSDEEIKTMSLSEYQQYTMETKQKVFNAESALNDSTKRVIFDEALSKLDRFKNPHEFMAFKEQN